MPKFWWMKEECSTKKKCCNFLRKPSTMNSSTCWEREKKPELTTINRPRMPKGELFYIQHGQ
eukprot:4505329-Amphidinium_carterae.1